MKRNIYFLRLILICAIMTSVFFGLKQTNLEEYILPVFLWIPLIFTVITGSEHLVLDKTIKTNPKRFSPAFMLASFVKLFLILIVTVIYLLIDKSQIIPFVVVLFVNYLVFTVYEVQALLKLVK